MINKKNEDIIDTINPEDAKSILKIIAKENPNIDFEKIIKEYLKKVNIDEVADSLFEDLKFIEVEELWESSGKTRDGYTEPVERADEMIEEVLEPYFEELEKYVKISMFNEAKSYCKGILKGVYKFDKELPTEFSEWATDIADNFIPMILEKWKEICTNKNDINDVKEYVTKILHFEMPSF